jgi:hypothetical protein
MALKHAVSIGEDHAVTANSTNTGIDDPEAAASDIRSNPANPLNAAYWNKDGKYPRSAHEAAVQKHNELLQMASAKQSKR